MIKKSDGSGNTMYTYVKCPACGNKKKHYEQISAEAVKDGTAKPGFTAPYDYKSGLVVDPVIDAALPLGAKVRFIQTAIDVCETCGCLYAPMVVRGRTEKKLTTPGEQKKRDGRPEFFGIDGKKIFG